MFWTPAWYFVVAFILFFSLDDRGARAQAVVTPPKGGPHSDPHCGLYSLYSIAKGFGIENIEARIWKPEYCSQPKGSSLDELRQAAEVIGLHALPVGDMSLGDLQRISLPSILNTRATVDAPGFHHYVAFLDAVGKDFLVHDPPTAPRLISAIELGHMWNGAALLVSNEPIDEELLSPGADIYGVATILLGSMLLVCVHLLRKHRPSWSGSPMVPGQDTDGSGYSGAKAVLDQSVILLITASSLGLLYHGASNAGVFQSGDILDRMSEKHLHSLLPQLSLSEARAWSTDSSVLFIDARYKNDYDAGHIAGAINVPPDSGPLSVSQTLEALKGKERIVIYCQSRKCPFSGGVAALLKKLGVDNIWIFRGGWNDWIRSEDLV